MKQQAFEQKYRADWQQLKQQLDRFEGVKPVASKNQAAADAEPSNTNAEMKAAAPVEDDLLSLPANYRRLCQQLAIARRRHYGSQLIDDLNELALRGHNRLYGSRAGVSLKIVQFFSHDFPRAVRQRALLFWLSTALFYVPLFAMALLCFFKPAAVYLIMEPGQVAEMETMYSPERFADGGRLGERGLRDSGDDLYMFGFYIYNNIGIAFREYAGGILAGVFTVFVEVFNGVSIGAVAGYLISVGSATPFLTFVVAHGAFELTGLTLAAMGGLMLALAILNPGPRSRLLALRQAAAESMTILYGAFFLLLVAAFVEAYWSSISSFPPWLKYTVGLGCWLAVFAWLGLAGRGGVEEADVD